MLFTFRFNFFKYKDVYNDSLLKFSSVKTKLILAQTAGFLELIGFANQPTSALGLIWILTYANEKPNKKGAYA